MDQLTQSLGQEGTSRFAFLSAGRVFLARPSVASDANCSPSLQVQLDQAAEHDVWPRPAWAAGLRASPALHWLSCGARY